MVVAWTAVFLAVGLDDFLLAGVDAEAGEVDRVGTHIRDLSALVEPLGHHHRLAHGEAQLAGCLLLQRRGGEGRCRRALQRLLLHVADDKLCRLALLQESQHLVVRLQTGIQLGLHFRDRPVGVGQTEDGVHTVEGFALESLYLALALHDEADGHALHTSGREGRLHLAPQHG